ncbi:MAG TPA: sugar transferase [Caulobacteraceae bacterium]|nr:sugar transferase [Caulobacteraceae bacterium]
MSQDVLASGAFIGVADRSNRRGARPNRFISTANVLIALALILLLLPLLILIAVAIFMEGGGPVLFAHPRIGQHRRRFPCLKFRTMVKDADRRLAAVLAQDPVARGEWEKDHKLRNDPRITALGALLRRSSLDELPQLFNVVRGEMALVGPRPIVEAEVPRYGRRIRHYLSVKPGITGLWQVSGRNDVAYSARVAMDCLYVQKKSALLDAWLLVRTIPAVLVRRGSY